MGLCSGQQSTTSFTRLAQEQGLVYKSQFDLEKSPPLRPAASSRGDVCRPQYAQCASARSCAAAGTSSRLLCLHPCPATFLLALRRGYFCYALLGGHYHRRRCIYLRRRPANLRCTNLNHIAIAEQSVLYSQLIQRVSQSSL